MILFNRIRCMSIQSHGTCKQMKCYSFLLVSILFIGSDRHFCIINYFCLIQKAGRLSFKAFFYLRSSTHLQALKSALQLLFYSYCHIHYYFNCKCFKTVILVPFAQMRFICLKSVSRWFVTSFQPYLYPPEMEKKFTKIVRVRNMDTDFRPYAIKQLFMFS